MKNIAAKRKIFLIISAAAMVLVVLVAVVMGPSMGLELGGGTVGVIFPILSRNRFAICLRGIARGADKIVLMLSYPSDEVGNHLISEAELLDSGVQPYSETLSLARYRELFGSKPHPFTGVDYVDYYETLIREEGADCEIIFSNRPEAILGYTKKVLCCDIHSRELSARRVKAAGGEVYVGRGADGDIIVSSAKAYLNALNKIVYREK